MKGYRKAILSLIFALIGVALTYFGKFDEIISDYLWNVFCVLVAGNSIEYLAYMKKPVEGFEKPRGGFSAKTTTTSWNQPEGGYSAVMPKSHFDGFDGSFESLEEDKNDERLAP